MKICVSYQCVQSTHTMYFKYFETYISYLHQTMNASPLSKVANSIQRNIAGGIGKIWLLYMPSDNMNRSYTLGPYEHMISTNNGFIYQLHNTTYVLL